MDTHHHTAKPVISQNKENMKKDNSDDRWGISVVDTTEYFRAFTTYLDFWDRALDEYKTELNLLKFPIFKHLYLDMLQLNESGSAFEFLHKYKVVFDSNSDRKKEIQYFESLKDKDSISSKNYTELFEK